MRVGQIRLGLAFRLALRELRGGLGGFYIFLACIALGTGAIAAVNSVSGSISQSMSEQGRTLLAADLRFELVNRVASAAELAYLKSLGDLSVSTGLRSMARRADGQDQSLVEVKAVDGAYPLYGAFTTQEGKPLADLIARQGDEFGAVAAPLLLERLGLKVGDTLLLGSARLRITGTVANEPDALSEGFGFAPRLMIAGAALEATGLVQTGSLVEHAYRIRLPAGSATPEAIAKQANDTYPDAGWAIRRSERAAPALSDNITRFSQFLTLVGLTALIVGGIGVANAVRAFLDTKRQTIATFKCLGAPAGTIFAIYLIQILLIAAIAIVAGLVLGAIAPMIAAGFLAQFLPVSTTPTLYPRALALAAGFGVLTALAFAILPLGRARAVPATALFREQGFETSKWPAWPYLLAAGVVFALLAGLAIFTAFDRFIASVFLGAIAASFVILRLVAALVTLIAARSPRSGSPALRLAIGNIYRPGALTASVVLSLGLGLTLLVTLTLIDGNLRRELTGNMAEKAPNFFFVDIQSADLDRFRGVLEKEAPEGKFVQVPMLRGRILAFNDKDVATLDVPPSGRWVLRGDRGITYSEALPENATLLEGAWWAPDYAGEPVVSFSADEARDLGLKIGDTVTVNVLGRSVTARIANFRKVEWKSLTINFVMVFSPNTFKGAPHAWLATMTDPEATAQEETSLLRAVTNAFPTVTSVRVKDALDVMNTLVGQLATAIRAAASVALVSSVLVLAGALAAGNRARAHDAVVLKTLGASRAMLIRAFTYEYLILGLATAVFALFAGAVANWFVVTRIMQLPSVFLPDVAVSTLVIALAVTVGIGLAGTWRILGLKSAPFLREL